MYKVKHLGALMVLATALCSHAAFSENVLMDRIMADGRRAMLLRTTVEEEYPLEVQHSEGFVFARGGRVEIDIDVLLVLGSGIYQAPTVAWTKAHTTFGLHRDSVLQDLELWRLKVYDAEMHKGVLYIVYTEDTRVAVDIVRLSDEEEWRTVNSIELFVQKDGGWSARLVESARFVSDEEKLYLTFAIVNGEEPEVWEILSDEATAVPFRTDDEK